MFGVHTPELLIVLAIAVLLFGAKRLPEMGSAVGKTIKEFRTSVREEPQGILTPSATAPRLPAPGAATPGEASQDQLDPSTVTQA